MHACNTYTIAYRSQDGTRFGLVEYFVLGWITLVFIKQLDSVVSRQAHFGVTEPAINHVTNIIPVQEFSRWNFIDVETIENKRLLVFHLDVMIYVTLFHWISSKCHRGKI